MPGGDRTGPMGYGPMTGRRLGYCAGYQVPGFTNTGGGMGMGWRRGRGRGFGRAFRSGPAASYPGFGVPYPPPPVVSDWVQGSPAATPADELSALKNEAANLSRTLEQINARIERLTEEEGLHDEA